MYRPETSSLCGQRENYSLFFRIRSLPFNSLRSDPPKTTHRASCYPKGNAFTPNIRFSLFKNTFWYIWYFITKRETKIESVERFARFVRIHMNRVLAKCAVCLKGICSSLSTLQSGCFFECLRLTGKSIYKTNRAIWLVCSHYWGPLAAFYLWLGRTLRNLHLESKWSKWAHELHHCATGSFHLVEQGDLRKSSSRPRKDCFHREVMKPFLSVLDGDLEPAFPLPRLASSMKELHEKLTEAACNNIKRSNDTTKFRKAYLLQWAISE